MPSLCASANAGPPPAGPTGDPPQCCRTSSPARTSTSTATDVTATCSRIAVTLHADGDAGGATASKDDGTRSSRTHSGSGARDGRPDARRRRRRERARRNRRAASGTSTPVKAPGMERTPEPETWQAPGVCTESRCRRVSRRRTVAKIVAALRRLGFLLERGSVRRRGRDRCGRRRRRRGGCLIRDGNCRERIRIDAGEFGGSRRVSQAFEGESPLDGRFEGESGGPSVPEGSPKWSADRGSEDREERSISIASSSTNVDPRPGCDMQ